MAPAHPGRRLKRVWVLLAATDIRQLGQAISSARPSVRFRADDSRRVERSIPADARTVVHMADAALAPGYDLPEPDLELGETGIGIQLIVPRIEDHEMRAGEVSTLYRPDDPAHVAFVDAVFAAVQRVTKPHVLTMTGARANVRIGQSAEEWWRADDRRRLRHESSLIYFRLADRPGSRDIPRDRDRLYAILVVVVVAAIVLVMVLWFGATQFGWIIGPHAD